MTILEQIIDHYPDESFLKADGFDEAIIGVCEAYDEPKLVYSVSKCIEILKKEMTEEEAVEHFGFNVEGAYMGAQTPIWCHDEFL